MADPLRIAQVLSNLLTNAAKYTDPEGTILLAATCELDEVVIRVSDSGIGIAAGALPEIFGMFAQVHSTRDRSEGGLGIGLALTKGLVELHGGKIEVRSAGLGRVVLLDIGMPGLDGYEVAQKMRRARPAAAITFIAVTGWGQEHDKERAFAAGFDYHLTKPVDFDRLAQLVRLAPKARAAGENPGLPDTPPP